MLINKSLAVAAALLLGSASTALARDATRSERAGQPQRHAAPRAGAVVNSFGPGAPAWMGPSAAEQAWMERASRVSESSR
jgi:hypothetical protein